MHSTRLEIVQRSLDDSHARLSELPPSSRARELEDRYRGLESTYRTWKDNPPSEAERISLMRRVLELNVEVIAACQELTR